MIEESYYPHILKQTQTYKVTLRGKTVAFYTVSVRSISLQNSDAPVSENYWKEPIFSAVIINYIAVDKRLHRNGIGTTILESVVDEARALYHQWPVRLVVLEALRQKVDWYLDRGFDAINQADLEGTSETVKLYLDLMPSGDKGKIEEYTSSFYQ